MKRFSLWLKLAAGFQFVTCLIHSVSLFVKPQPANDIERQLVELMNYKLDFGAGFHRSMSEVTTALSACFCLVCLLGALLNWYLLRKGVSRDVMTGVININLVVFGLCFLVMALFTFLPPITLTGLIFIFLVLARLMVKNPA